MSNMSGGPYSDFFDRIKVLCKICKKWNEVEELIKQVENINGAPIFDSIYELRHAGREIVYASHSVHKKETGSNFQSYLDKANQRIMNARHIAVIGACTHICDMAGYIRDEIGQDRLQERFPEYGEFFAEIKKTGNIIIKIMNGTDREVTFEELEKKTMPYLIVHYERLEASAPAIKTAKEQELEKDRLQKKFHIKLASVGWFLATVIIVITAIRLIL